MPSTRRDRKFGLATSVAVKAPVVVASTAFLVLSGSTQIIDGRSASTGERILVKNQSGSTITGSTLNGIYEIRTGDWQRSADCDGFPDLVPGSQVFVTTGSTENDQGGRYFTVDSTSSTDGFIRPDTDAMDWKQLDALLNPKVISTGEVVTSMLADGAVTLVKMADLDSQRFIGRNTASTGAPESLDVATVKTMLGIVAGSTSDRYNVKDYGASTTSTDNSPEIQLAIDAAEAAGGVTYLPTGTWDIESGVNIDTSIGGFVGDGPYNSILRPTVDFAGDIFHVGSTDGVSATVNNIYLSNFKVDPSVVQTAGAAVHMERVARCLVDNVITAGQDGSTNLYNGVWWEEIDTCYQSHFDIKAANDGMMVNGDAGVGNPKAGLFLDNGRILNCTVGMRCGGAFGGLYLSHMDIIANYSNVVIDQTLEAEFNREIFFGNTVSIDSGSTDNVAINDAGGPYVQFDGTWIASSTDGAGVRVASAGVGTEIVFTGGTIFNNNDGILIDDADAIIVVDGTFIRENSGFGVNASVATVKAAINAHFFGNSGGEIHPNVRNTATVHISNTPLKLVESDGSANAGPRYILDRNSTTPAANDEMGDVVYRGRNSTAAAIDYVRAFAKILVPTAGSESAAYEIQTYSGGNQGTRLRVQAGTIIGDPTGGDKGVGSVNATGYYVNGVLIGTGGGSVTGVLGTFPIASDGNSITPTISVAYATESTSGVIRIATNAETLAATATNVVLSVQDMATWWASPPTVLGSGTPGAAIIGNLKSSGFQATQGAASLVTNEGHATNANYTGNVFLSRATRAANAAYNLYVGFSSNLGDKEFQVTGAGVVTADGTITGGGADYAEYFEWDDGNLKNEDRRGHSVILLPNGKIREARRGDRDLIGIVSANPTLTGNAAWNKWHGKYQRDRFGAYILSCKGNRWRNPKFDPKKIYIPRADRQEWGCVGLVGRLRLVKGQPTDPRWLFMGNVSKSIEEWLVR